MILMVWGSCIGKAGEFMNKMRQWEFGKWKHFLTIPGILFGFLLLVKEYLARAVIFGDLHLLTTLTVSLPTVVVLVTAIELLARKRTLTVYMIVNFVITTIYFAAIMYYKYFGIVVTYRALQQAGMVTEINASVFNLMHPYFLLIYVDIVILAILLWRRPEFRTHLRTRALSINHKNKVIISLFLIALLANVTRVNAHKDIVNDVKRAERMGLINYELFTIFKDLQPPERVDPSIITLDGIRELKGITDPNPPLPEISAKDKHVIVVQLESFQDFLIGLEVNGREITPNLNRFAKEAHYFPNVYQQVGQGNTSDAEFVLNTSLYTPERGAASEEYSKYDLPSLPKLLKTYGYESLTFHTNDVAFWNRKNLYAALGFDEYYDAEFFDDEDMIAFGSSDEVLYERAAEVIGDKHREGKKVYANLISMSAHHPYHLPKDKILIDLPPEYDNTLVGDYLRAQHYADYAFGVLVEELKAQGLWDEAVLFVYGDHVGLTMNLLTNEERALLRQLLGKEYSYDEMLNIPLMIRVPGDTGRVFAGLGGQVDFLPTLAYLLEIPLDDRIYFGQNLYAGLPNLLGQRYYLPSGSFINDSLVFIPGEEIRDGLIVPLETESGKMLKTQQKQVSFEQLEDEFRRAMQLMTWSESYVETLPLRK